MEHGASGGNPMEEDNFGVEISPTAEGLLEILQNYDDQFSVTEDMLDNPSPTTIDALFLAAELKMDEVLSKDELPDLGTQDLSCLDIPMTPENNANVGDEPDPVLVPLPILEDDFSDLEITYDDKRVRQLVDVSSEDELQILDGSDDVQMVDGSTEDVQVLYEESNKSDAKIILQSSSSSSSQTSSTSCGSVSETDMFSVSSPESGSSLESPSSPSTFLSSSPDRASSWKPASSTTDTSTSSLSPLSEYSWESSSTYTSSSTYSSSKM